MVNSLRHMAAALVPVLLLTGCGRPPENPGSPAGVASDPASGPSAEPEPTPTPTSTPAEPRRATVVMNGDLLWHNTLVMSAADNARRSGGGATLDFAPILAGVRPVVETADMAICHNEVPIAPPGGPYRFYPSFRAPQETLDAVRATGFDLCTTVSNHSLDDGWDGLVRTVRGLQDRGVLVAGTAETQAQADRPAIFTTTTGVRIAVVSGTYGTNGYPRPRGREWSVPDLDVETMIRKAGAARADGADIVLAAIHGGEEYDHAPNAEQRRVAEQLTASDDIDLVYGHHVHVVQPITRINGKWVAFGLGNLVAQHHSDVPAGYEGITMRFTFVERNGRFEVDLAEYFPTLVTRYSAQTPARVLLVGESLERGVGDRARMLKARDRTRRVVHSVGNADGLAER